MFSLRVWIGSLGTAGTISFVLCVLYGLWVGESLHAKELLEQVLPGFTWLTLGSFALGVVESFLWGAYIAVLFVPLHNLFYRRWSGHLSSRG